MLMDSLDLCCAGDRLIILRPQNSNLAFDDVYCGKELRLQPE